MSRNDKTYSDKEPDHWSRNPENLRSSYWNHQRKICQEAEDAKKAAADLVEWRADFFEELMNPEAARMC